MLGEVGRFPFCGALPAACRHRTLQRVESGTVATQKDLPCPKAESRAVNAFGERVGGTCSHKAMLG